MGRKSRDIIGEKYGKLTVLEMVSKGKGGQRYRCVCDCGKEKIVVKSNLTSGRTKSCGCIRKSKKNIELVDELSQKLKIEVLERQFEKKSQNKALKVTEDNYFSLEINMSYLDCTTYKNFVGTPGIKACEARALAEAKGEIEHPVSTPLLVGSYVDAYFSGELDKFKAEHPEIISSRGATAGELKSDYKQADVMIKRAEREPLFMQFMQGDTQKIFTGEIEGVPFRIKVDSIDGKRITDLKTVASLNKTYYAADLGERLDFTTHWGYDLQGCIYREIVRQNTGETLPFYICAISKDKSDGIAHPRVAVIQIPDQILDDALAGVKSRITSVWDIMQGNIDPVFCGSCDYCADTLPIERIITPDELLAEV